MQETNKDTFVYAPTFYEQIDAIKSREIRYLMHEAIARYGIYGEQPDFSEVDKYGVMDGLFLSIKEAIDNAKRRRDIYIENGRKGAEFGKLGGRPRKTPPPPPPDDKPQNAPAEEIITAEEVNPNKTPKRFVKPTIRDIREFIFDNGLNADAEAIFDYYESNGWKVGNNPMRDWRASVRNWARRNEQPNTEARKKDTGIHFGATSAKDYEDWITDNPEDAKLMQAIAQGWANGERELKEQAERRQRGIF